MTVTFLKLSDKNDLNNTVMVNNIFEQWIYVLLLN